MDFRLYKNIQISTHSVQVFQVKEKVSYVEAVKMPGENEKHSEGG